MNWQQDERGKLTFTQEVNISLELYPVLAETKIMSMKLANKMD
jgi:hypothetical protein